MVYVLSIEGKPLMPMCYSFARKRLKQGLAKIVRKCPFTIKLLYETTNNVDTIDIGIDLGSNIMGSAAVNKKTNKVLYIAETTIRNDIKTKMDRRRAYRRTRRQRKTRYRPARWLNRRNSIRLDRYNPTLVSKINSHIKEINFIKSILPINKVIIEYNKFDPHLMMNPLVQKYKWLYQKGINFGFANTKSYVLHRDNYTCQQCKKTKLRLEVHHITPRSQNGSDEAENLIALCTKCHHDIHGGSIVLKKLGKKKSKLNHATHVNIIRNYLEKYFKFDYTYGFITKSMREILGLSKTHYNDAICIALNDSDVDNLSVTNLLYLKHSVAKGDYQQTKGSHSQVRIPTGKLFGFRKFDKVKYLNNIYFIKGRMSTGYAQLMDINNNIIKLKPIPKFIKMERINSRKSVLIDYICLPVSTV